MGDPARKRTVTLSSLRWLSPDVALLGFALEPGEAMRFDPGQFVTFYIPKGPVTVTRSYSICSSPHRTDGFDLVIKRVDGGYVSSHLCARPVGERIQMIGPLGRFRLHEPDGRTVIFACTGTGIAPFLPMTEELFEQRPSARANLFFGTRSEDGLLFRDELIRFQQAHPSFEYIPVLSRPSSAWVGVRGHLQEPLQARWPDLSKCEVYICGVPPMVAEVQQLVERLHGVKEQTFVERY